MELATGRSPFRTRDAAIHSIPVEILVEILELTREWECWWTDPSEIHNDIIPSYGCLKNLAHTFSQVCCRWRYIIQNTAQFWSTIRGNHASMDRLFDNLSRVGDGVMLNIHFTGPAWNMPEVSIGWMAPIAHRIRRLSLEGHLTDFPTRTFDRLEVINATAVLLGADFDSVFAQSRLRAPNLRQATISQCFIDRYPLPTQALSHVHLTRCEVVPSALLEFLGRAMFIESLSIQDPVSYRERRPLDADAVFDMPRLQNFAMSGPLPWLIDHLKLPSLSNVIVMGPQAFEPVPYTDLTSRSAARLKSMIFKDSFIFEGHAMQLLDTISSLTEIAFSRTHSQMTTSFLSALHNRSDSHSALVLPNLELMTIVGARGLKGVRSQSIKEVLQSRDTSGGTPVHVRKYGPLLRDVFASSRPRRSYTDECATGTLSQDFLGRNRGEITQVFF